MKVKNDPIRKNKTFTSLQSTKQKPADRSPTQFRQLAKDKESRGFKQDQSHIKDKSLNDSESSDSSCYEKKFYRCGCLSHGQGCGAHKYHDYLGIMREERERKKRQRSFSELIKGNIEKGMAFLDSEGEGEEDSKFQAIKTPEKEVNELDKIAQINESAEYSMKKAHESITITVGNKRYSKVFGDKEEAIKCLELIKQLISSSEMQQ